MSAIQFIIHALLSLALFVVLARLLLQWSRADFHNPMCEAVVRLTNPLILPMRRVLPPIRKIDTATVVAVILIAFLGTAIDLALLGVPFPPGMHLWVRSAILAIEGMLVITYLIAIFLYALLSLIDPIGDSPLKEVLATVCVPVLRPFRRLIPSVAGLDLSPLWAGIAIKALDILFGELLVKLL